MLSRISERLIGAIFLSSAPTWAMPPAGLLSPPKILGKPCGSFGYLAQRVPADPSPYQIALRLISEPKNPHEAKSFETYAKFLQNNTQGEAPLLISNMGKDSLPFFDGIVANTRNQSLVANINLKCMENDSADKVSHWILEQVQEIRNKYKKYKGDKPFLNRVKTNGISPEDYRKTRVAFAIPTSVSERPLRIVLDVHQLNPSMQSGTHLFKRSKADSNSLVLEGTNSFLDLRGTQDYLSGYPPIESLTILNGSQTVVIKSDEIGNHLEVEIWPH